MTNTTEEELLNQRNEQFMARTETCINCGAIKTWVEYFSENCPKADPLRGLAHVFINNVLPYQPIVCGVPDCGEKILDGSWQFTVVDTRALATCSKCCDKFLELTLRGKYD